MSCIDLSLFALKMKFGGLKLSQTENLYQRLLSGGDLKPLSYTQVIFQVIKHLGN